MSSHEGIFSTLTIIVLILALIIFLIALINSYKQDKVIRGNYNLYFSSFLTMWITVELVNHFSDEGSEVLFQLMHLFILLILAIWMNLRFYWAIKTAKKGDD